MLNIITVDYDAMALSPEINCPPSFDQTRFSVEDDSILVAAKKLLAVLRKVCKKKRKNGCLFLLCIET